MKSQEYKIRVVRGAFTNPGALDKLGAKTIEKLERSEWQSVDKLVANLEQIKKLQRLMTRHYDDATVPWYMDGYDVEDKNEIIVAFGADDGASGKIFQFKRSDVEAVSEVVRYGISKGIPKEQMDFMDVAF